MARRKRERRSTGFAVFLTGAAMGVFINLLTNTADSWPRPLRFISRDSWMFAAVVVLVVGSNAAYQWFRRRVRRPQWSGENPYPGLLAYEPDRRGVFFGRITESRDLVDRIHDSVDAQTRFVPVVGPSGSGKSSLMMAGVLPMVERWATVAGPFNPDDDVLGELARTLAQLSPRVDETVFGESVRAEAHRALAAAQAMQPVGPPHALIARLDQIRRGHRVVLVIDQLEETVTIGSDEDRYSLLSLLESALYHDHRLVVVATVRSEFLGHFQQGPGADLFRQPFVVNVMARRALRQVITGPAEMTDTTFDDGLVDQIVAEAAGGDVLPMLSYLLSGLYADHGHAGHISRGDYEAAGGLAAAIAHRADAVLAGFVVEQDGQGKEAESSVLDLLTAFVSFDDAQPTRRRTARTDFTAAQQRVLDRFIAARLLVSDDKSGTGAVQLDLAHEALLRQWPPLRDRVAMREERLRRRSELEILARGWQRAHRRADYLIAGSQLREGLATLSETPGASQLLTDFLVVLC
jgi:AAA ATPase domain